MNNLKVTIGIEIHTELKSNTKIFSSSQNIYGKKPNTLINEIDLGYPGTLPILNKKCVELGIQLASSLNMEIARVLSFDRKHYNYPDLPKGFQITQQFNPIGKKGSILISKKEISIERIHLEEDTAKLITEGERILIDYNRAGVPLIEIVSDPVMHSAQEAAEYITEIKNTLSFLEISDAKMEEGSMRCDINVSLAPYGSKVLGQKVEIKNINSIANVVKAIEFEIARQKSIILGNGTIDIETRRWDDSAKKTILMRKKTTQSDYQFIKEPNIRDIKLSESFIQETISKMPRSISEVKTWLNAEGLSQKEIDLLINNYEIYKVFLKLNNIAKSTKESYNWIVVELSGLVNAKGSKIENTDEFTINQIAEMIKLINIGEINGKQAKSILQYIFEEKITVAEIIKKYNMEQIKNPEVIMQHIVKIFTDYKTFIDAMEGRLERVEKYVLGMLMKATNGQANPKISKEVFDKYISSLK
jgi:aspartyl-tRNA(Asn)/glutamyl-tRNA(Gln) amidotransferase subunit B